ncbi:hypothetical protein [Actinomadura latina]|uniref:Uncharacterized protein n=1 Tax=Actinomadura latina TaxID=163603 RepID=A0A846YR83_9ACTN|nr:hypothetical protein [Actinomadura latina]NKZ02799.1 hypothetical protein [Actinomadura latina]
MPAILFLISDLRPKGAHERPLSGITYGISAGMLIGAGEVALTGIATLKAPFDDLVASPYPYLFGARPPSLRDRMANAQFQEE